MIKDFFKKGINGNTLKIIALIGMTLDHLGLMIFDQADWLRIIGRLAMPIFAYMIAEGCKYTKNKLKYFLTVFLIGFGCQIVYYIVDESLYMGILIDFSISILIIYSIDYAMKSKNFWSYLLVLFALTLTVFLVYPFADIFHLDLSFDYGIVGIMLPVGIYLFNNKWLKLLAMSIILLPLCIGGWELQWFCYLALIPLALYNGKRGKYKLKYLFYIYYPLHLVIIYFIAMLI